MPFIQPYPTNKNNTRYKTIDCSSDFILQEHRYSLRKRRHLYWVRIITRGTKPRLKVAESVSEEQIRQREWKYITEDLLQGIPPALENQPPGSEERTTWLLEKLLRVKRQLGDEDDISGDEEDDEDEDDEDVETKAGDMYECEATTESKEDSINAFGRAMSEESLDPCLLGKPPLVSSKTSRFNMNLVRHLRNRSSGLVNSPSSGGNKAPGRKRPQSVDLTVPGSCADEFDNEKAFCGKARTPSRDSFESDPSSEGGTIFFPSTPPPVKEKKRKALLRAGMSSIGLGRYRSESTANPPNDGTQAETLPPYLTEEKPKKEKLTMEQLKKDHEQKSQIMAASVATAIAIVFRSVSFDAFLLLLVALNVAVCWLVHHRHSFVKKFAKSSIKRRVKFTKQVWGSRWGKSSNTKSGATDSQQDESVNQSRRNIARSISQPLPDAPQIPPMIAENILSTKELETVSDANASSLLKNISNTD
uniref:Uncharacterized protein n=1 Tax=Mucochytrium quahogii TaxID=96639 RepID=A0A7S2RW18_9STRA|mmetsp:Transcript_3853/g.7075  ORF Transcript_3853/g.7075 Transcript_3853/m.7075 type:complete len:475 (+) Transcript_3853:147-1571(+)|eukprot:CAMPEP_0203762584 /NCGR_PEP_ID=MMETSP0098-20131031/15433_1 /ASSEMBLY_ACC=CAM_ASM_000208 /TAXON_ID=96639 /ORGANISM=" , Strain NY0313808BC1" /LENGTH=474 /DNA_ID=CAMNT_0050657047 /DNA_START=115 /DNA_END=1539 /DNA_ORIENTATION=+